MTTKSTHARLSADAAALTALTALTALAATTSATTAMRRALCQTFEHLFPRFLHTPLFLLLVVIGNKPQLLLVHHLIRLDGIFASLDLACVRRVLVLAHAPLALLLAHLRRELLLCDP